MADKKGAALIFGLVVVTFLFVLCLSFYYKSIGEANMALRFTDSTRALWAAEAGLARAVTSLPSNVADCPVAAGGSCFSAETTPVNAQYYSIVSQGYVPYAGGNEVARTIEAKVRLGAVDPSKFERGIETTVGLNLGGSYDINPDDSHREYSSTVNFTNMFNFNANEVKEMSTVLTEVPTENFVDKIYWLESSEEDSWNINSNLVGSGILVVVGDLDIEGSFRFTGIIYVIGGQLKIRGTPVITGSIIAESGATVGDTSMLGNPTINYSQEAIAHALYLLQLASPTVVSWKEVMD